MGHSESSEPAAAAAAKLSNNFLYTNSPKQKPTPSLLPTACFPGVYQLGHQGDFWFKVLSQATNTSTWPFLALKVEKQPKAVSPVCP